MDERYAELMGMHSGDGTLYRTNKKSIVWELRGGLDETEYYTNFVAPLLQDLFGSEFKPKHRSGGGRGSFGIQTANKSITSFLSQFFPIGEKSSRVYIASEIFTAEQKVKCAFLRGLFDTDGCIRFDKNHTSRHYYPKIEFGFASIRLRNDVVSLLSLLGIGCYTWDDLKRNSYRICVPGKKNLQIWNSIIASNNPKHLNKLFRE